MVREQETDPILVPSPVLLPKGRGSGTGPGKVMLGVLVKSTLLRALMKVATLSQKPDLSLVQLFWDLRS